MIPSVPVSQQGSSKRRFLQDPHSNLCQTTAAEGHPDVILADDALVAATLAFERLKAQRSRAEIVIDVWRSLEASRRKVN